MLYKEMRSTWANSSSRFDVNVVQTNWLRYGEVSVYFALNDICSNAQIGLSKHWFVVETCFILKKNTITFARRMAVIKYNSIVQ